MLIMMKYGDVNGMVELQGGGYWLSSSDSLCYF